MEPFKGWEQMQNLFLNLMAGPQSRLCLTYLDDNWQGYMHTARFPDVAAGVGHGTARRSYQALRGKSMPSPPQGAGSGPKPWFAQGLVVCDREPSPCADLPF